MPGVGSMLASSGFTVQGMTKLNRSVVWTWIGLALGAFVLVELALLLDVARSLTIDYYDSFEYLRNARVLSEHGHSPLAAEYLWRRPPLVPLLQAALYPAGAGAAGAEQGLVAAHVLAWGFSAGALGLIYGQLSASFDRSYALIGTFLVAANPIFLHLVPFGLVDIPAMFFTVLALSSYMRARSTNSVVGALLCGASLAAAMATKYNLVLLVPCLLLFELDDAMNKKSATGGGPLRALVSRRSVLIFGAAAASWYGLHLAIHVRLEGLHLDSFVQVFQTLLGETGMVASVIWDDPPSEYVQEIYQTSTLALLACGLLGLYLSFRRGQSRDRLHLYWLLVFLFVMSFGIGSKSSRYLLPILPSLVHIQLRGVEWCHARLAKLVAERSARGAGLPWMEPIGSLLGLSLILWLPLTQSVGQIRHFEDPVYRSPFIRYALDTIRDSAGPEAPIYWRGAFFSMYPEDPIFFPHDETFYFYHLGPPAFEYFLNRPVLDWQDSPTIDHRVLIEKLPKDSVVVNSLPFVHLTHRAHLLPTVPDPLQLLFVERRTFIRKPLAKRSAEPASGAEPLVYAEASGARARVQLERADSGFELDPPLGESGWVAWLRAGPAAPLRRIGEPSADDPEVIELIRVRSELIDLRGIRALARGSSQH